MTRSIEERLTVGAELLRHMPILSAASAKEPWIKLRLVDINAVQAVLDGETHPDEWVSVRCGARMGENGPQFEHSAHHWSDYQDGRDPLRVTHYCDGGRTEPANAHPETEPK